MNYSVSEWNKLHQKPQFRPKYPSEYVVRFMYSCFSLDLINRGKIKILDIGCGGGRHIKLFAENGFNTYGVDFSSVGIEYSNIFLSEYDLTAELMKSDMKGLPYKDEFFDGAISFGVFYYTDSLGMKKSISDLHRIMKVNGKAFINLRTINDYRFGKGEEIERNTFVLDIQETNEYNMKMHFLCEKDVYDYFSIFKEIKLEKNEFTKNNLKVLNSDWLITVVK
tara:strand:+ start:427 stop:1095 length:669 start_codon:yes stop_codon:yes gene_type:complete